MTYVICVNKPGYLPESEPVEVDTIQEARDAAAEEVQRSMDAFGDDREAQARYGFTAAEEQALDLPEDGGVIHMPDGYVIDVTRKDGQ